MRNEPKPKRFIFDKKQWESELHRADYDSDFKNKEEYKPNHRGGDATY
jgi:hypothetical protein